MTSPLLAPFTFRNGTRARNHVWLAPMTNQQSHADGSLSDDELHWLEVRARGGFGVIETCAAHVSRDGQGWPGELGVYDDALLPGLTRVASSMTALGALSLVQIFHGGTRAPSSLTGQRPWSASEPAEAPRGAERPRAGTEDEIKGAIDAFRDAAVRSHAAGFSGVELHGAHGYLLNQFLSSANVRTDGWGGSFEERTRLLRETTRAVRSAVPDGFLVGVRLSPEDFGQARGMDLDESLATAKGLADDGVDFIHVSLWDWTVGTKKRPGVHAVPLFRAELPRDVALVVAGNIWTRADAETLLAQGADGVALGRSAIANPSWPQDITDPAWEPRRPPLTVAELRARGLNADFAGYMRQWKGFVAD